MNIINLMNIIREDIKSSIIGELDIQKCEGVKLALIKENDFLFVPVHDTWTGSLVGYDEEQQVSVLLRDGKFIKDFVKKRGEHGSNYAHEETFYEKGQTIADGLAEMGFLPSDVMAIFVVHRGYNTVDHYSTGEFTVDVKVAPK